MTLHTAIRERLRTIGMGGLTNAELLTLVLGAADSDTAEALLATTEGSLRGLAAKTPAELLRVTKGLGPVKAVRLAACFEVGTRYCAEARGRRFRIKDPADVRRFLGHHMRDLNVEEFHLLALDSQSQVIRDVLVTRGLLNSSLVHPREVFRAAIQEAAAGIIVVHNHPSGDPTPSAEDRAVTRQLAEAGRLLDIPVYDHVVIGGDRHFSFASEGLL